MSQAAQLIAAAAALVTALGVLWRWAHVGELLGGVFTLAKLAQLQRSFLVDWNGEPARPGVEARPSFPERMTSVEDKAELVDRRTAELNHELRGELVSRLVLLHDGQERLHDHNSEHAAALARLDARVTDHRRRNELQVEQLRVEVDRRLRTISGDLLRAETYRAALVELGLDIDPPPPVPDRPSSSES
jgi:hypothetical protein